MWFLFHMFTATNHKKPYLKLHHGLLHALYIKDRLDQLLDGFGKLRLGAGCRCQPLHCFLILPRNTEKMQSDTSRISPFKFSVCVVCTCP